jgi:hypothetical protein
MVESKCVYCMLFWIQVIAMPPVRCQQDILFFSIGIVLVVVKLNLNDFDTIKVNIAGAVDVRLSSEVILQERRFFLINNQNPDLSVPDQPS